MSRFFRAFHLLVLCFLFGCVHKTEFVDPGSVKNQPMRHGIWFGKKAEEKQVPVSADPEAEARGREIYFTHCMACHGNQGKGDGPMAKTLTSPPANLANFAAKFPRANFFMQISQGKGSMPAWKDTLSEKEISDLSRYIHVLLRK